MHARLIKRIDARLRAIESEGRWKDYRVFASAPSARMCTADGRTLLAFASNDYLGLAGDPRVVAAAEVAARRYGAGAASARFVCGTSALDRALEQVIAELCGCESALTFTSGWTANIALLATLPEEGDLVLSDSLNHASLIDGARLAAKGVERQVLPHGDLQACAGALEGWRGRGIAYIVSDGVFSMEGTLARLDALVDLARAHGAVLVVDDAHGLGVVGATGRGVAELQGVLGQVDIATGSLGKALGGVAGGFVAGPAALVRLIEQAARAFLFTTALTPAAAGASLEAIRILRAEPALVAELQGKVQRFMALLQEAGFPPSNSQSAIVPLMLGESARARACAAALEAAGIHASCFSYPVVSEGQARIRFQISRLHSEADLSTCVAACRRACRPG